MEHPLRNRPKVGQSLPKAVSAYCREHGIRADVFNAIDLVRQVFSSIAAIQVDLAEDPDGEDVRIVIEVNVANSAEKAFAEYDQFVTRWVDTAPWPARRLIRLSYNTVK
jgi:hypothetical protein